MRRILSNLIEVTGIALILLICLFAFVEKCS
jgi:hypothetical protein